MAEPRPPPSATYRLQFHAGFTFRDAERLVPYLAGLGVSHIYASPYLAARKGSRHGYDIVDHNALNPEIGDQAAFDSFVDTLHAHGLGQIVDFVPNHMGIGQADNAWWLDVLEWGRLSPAAHYFDIDWTSPKPELRGKVLLPFLGAHYGSVLEGGELRLAFDATTGSFGVWYYEHLFPVSPSTCWRILEPAAKVDPGGGLKTLSAGFKGLGQAATSRRAQAGRRARADALKAELAELVRERPAAAEAIATAVRQLNGSAGEPGSFTGLHRLLEAQAYRLAFWRTAADEINYRRFFDINDLAGLRIEESALFETVHRLLFRLCAEGRIDGVRIDHIDGLYDPTAYCRAMADRLRRLSHRPSAGGRGTPLPVFVEKILGAEEALPVEWPVAGTTGYDFLALVNGLFVDPRGERQLDRTFRRFTGIDERFDEVLYRCKRRVMEDPLAGELEVLASEVARVSEASWHTRDYTLNSLREGLKEIITDCEVYRTYIAGPRVRPEDRAVIHRAAARAQARRGDLEPELLTFLRDALTTDLVARRPSPFGYRRVVRFAMKVQQFTGPVMAKAMEDTAFYRYPRLLSLNEVGSDPRRFGTSMLRFHERVRRDAVRWPGRMLATSTHDTKRGEDARARISVLSELAGEWDGRVRRWARLNRPARTVVDGKPAPSATDEYAYYQTLVGSWPAEWTGEPAPDPQALETFAGRLRGWMVKAAREAKLETSWSWPNEAYEAALDRFVTRTLDRAHDSRFLDEFVPFQAGIARLGMLNSLSQTVLKLTVPGRPDIYQGSEFWDLSLVDPDNRRPVDFEVRRRALEAIRCASRGNAPAAAVAHLLDGWTDGRIKLLLTYRLLECRRMEAPLFERGDYCPLEISGPRAGHLCAFVRRHGRRILVVAVPRLVGGLLGLDAAAPWVPAIWDGTGLTLPEDTAGLALQDIVTGTLHRPHPEPGGPRLDAAALLDPLPVAALVSRPDS